MTFAKPKYNLIYEPNLGILTKLLGRVAARIVHYLQKQLRLPKTGKIIDGEKFIWDTQEKIADHLGISIRTFYNHCKFLSELGIITRIQGNHKNASRQRMYFYTVNQWLLDLIIELKSLKPAFVFSTIRQFLLQPFGNFYRFILNYILKALTINLASEKIEIFLSFFSMESSTKKMRADSTEAIASCLNEKSEVKSSAQKNNLLKKDVALSSQIPQQQEQKSNNEQTPPERKTPAITAKLQGVEANLEAAKKKEEDYDHVVLTKLENIGIKSTKAVAAFCKQYHRSQVLNAIAIIELRVDSIKHPLNYFYKLVPTCEICYERNLYPEIGAKTREENELIDRDRRSVEAKLLWQQMRAKLPAKFHKLKND